MTALLSKLSNVAPWPVCERCMRMYSNSQTNVPMGYKRDYKGYEGQCNPCKLRPIKR